MIRTRLTIVTDDLAHDISKIIDEIRGNDALVKLVIQEPLKIDGDQCYTKDTVLSASFMQCFSEVYHYDKLVYRGGKQ